MKKLESIVYAKGNPSIKRIGFFLLILLPLIGFFGCNNDSDNPTEEKVGVVIQEGDESRISTDNAGVVSTRNEEKTPSLNSISKSTGSEPVSDMPLVLVAEVDALTYNGTIMRSTHVCLNGDYAYVSYNYEGDTYLGAVDMIDISDPYTPKLLASAVFTDTDISSIAYSNGVLYLAGAREFIDGEDSNPAVLLKMTLNDGKLTDDIDLIDMPGYVGTDVAIGDNYVYGVSGDNGILGAYSYSDNTMAASVTISDLQSVGVNNGQVVILQNGAIQVFNASNLSQDLKFVTSSDVPDSKRTIDFYGSSVFAAEGASGTGIYSLLTGEKLNTIPVADATGLDLVANEIVTNAVSVNDQHIFVANGGVGVSVLKINSESITDLTDFGSLDLDGSSNFVKSEDDLVFVADGFGGLKILKMVTAEDAPVAGSGSCDNCTSYPSYSGGSWLNVNSGETLAYNGSASLAGINVNESLTWCGSLAVSEQLNINSGGTFVMCGALSFGAQYKTMFINTDAKLDLYGTLTVFGNLTLQPNSTLEAEGSITIMGDLLCEPGSNINFTGSGSTLTIMGNVTNRGVNVIGTYTDTYNKLN
ncbi:hypothetical protein QUH73_18645 [Labilibaculum sp. K2S]|uniref:hypothetical protein n=1 Tax=Labilibaculum sp. K2S TaxID=3056386 RepID=UPI0025A42CCC|nr:hypothetical protein [Labilibaculum sp. K2S]MDM8161842.1 hypothetical protein [Labilibaculum sp. K2S]